MDIRELLKAKPDIELVEDIKLGSNAFQEGVYELYLAEAKNRSLEIPEDEIREVQLPKKFDPVLFIDELRKRKFVPTSFTLQLWITISAFALFVLLRVLFPIYQDPNFSIEQFPVIQWLYVFSLMGSLSLVFVSYFINAISLFKAIEKLNNSSGKTLVIDERQIAVLFWIPLVNVLATAFLVFAFLNRTYSIRTKMSSVPLGPRIGFILLSISSVLVGIFLPYIVIARFERAAYRELAS